MNERPKLESGEGVGASVCGSTRPKSERFSLTLRILRRGMVWIFAKGIVAHAASNPAASHATTTTTTATTAAGAPASIGLVATTSAAA